jgi:transcription elongation factor Elf1
MSVFIDRSFLLRLSPKLQRFAQKKADLYNFRCPLCGDSQKNKTKSRGYIFRKKNDYFYMCHNCGVSTTFYNFLKQVDENLLREYALERYKNGETGNNNYPKPEFEEFKAEKPTFKKSLELPTIDSLPKAHFAKNYVQQRRIPETLYSQLYYAEDFAAFIQSLGIEKEGLHKDDKRLVIPFYDKDKNLVAVQGRSLGESKLRYITVKLHDDNKKVFGLDRLSYEEDDKIYVVEGPIDSMFLNNAVATADSNLQSIADVLDKTKVVLVYDNEPRNKDIVRIMEKAIDDHFNVVIWPEFIEEKDINEMVLGGFSPDEIQDIIDKNTFVNLRAKMEFVNWKKV